MAHFPARRPGFLLRTSIRLMTWSKYGRMVALDGVHSLMQASNCGGADCRSRWKWRWAVRTASCRRHMRMGRTGEAPSRCRKTTPYS
jgi:hypothetical protein